MVEVVWRGGRASSWVRLIILGADGQFAFVVVCFAVGVVVVLRLSFFFSSLLVCGRWHMMAFICGRVSWGMVLQGVHLQSCLVGHGRVCTGRRLQPCEESSAASVLPSPAVCVCTSGRGTSAAEKSHVNIQPLFLMITKSVCCC